MNLRVALGSIIAKDLRAYYLKPPHLSWGVIFPLAWAGMFFIRSGSGLDSVAALLPGVIAVSVLFGTTSMLAVTITFERKSGALDRLLLAPIPLEWLMLAKTVNAIAFGVANAVPPILLAGCLTGFSGVAWEEVIPTLVLIAVSSAFTGLFVAVTASEVFEAQMFSNFFRFPMLFLCGLFFPIQQLPAWLRPLSYCLPLTYGADALHASIRQSGQMPLSLDFGMLILLSALLFAFSVRNIRRRWIP
ncbi:MAG: ABC transporter permease [Verrucomicrobia bacterium]|nr:ABC transporter permease [Verrucomicrobiota bacterium]